MISIEPSNWDRKALLCTCIYRFIVYGTAYANTILRNGSQLKDIGVNKQHESAKVVVRISRAYRDEGFRRGGVPSALASSTPTFISPRHEPPATIITPRNLQLHHPSSV